ncbi:MAG TPA: SDR family NAD(P)-dependent oxidoreductase [Flavobacterium sp.]|jgi:short-subunit dehydrogenase
MNKAYFLSVRTIIMLASIFILLFQSCATWELGDSGRRKIAGKTYVIAGASSGFGRGVAEELGRCKANVVLGARRGELLEEIAQIIRTSGGTAVVVPMDISKPEDVERLMAAAVSNYGKVDVWINMAGVGAIGRMWEIPVQDQARLINVNLTGFVYGSHAAINQFRKQGYGVLINMGSVDSETPHAYQAAYSATKSGIRSMSLALSQELRLNDYKKIKVVTIEPWAVDTPFWRHAANYTGVEQKFAMMDEPNKVVNAILRKSLRPKKIQPVGWKAKGSSFFANVFPRLNESLTGSVAHKYQMEMPPAADNTSGAVHNPMETGRGVDDGVDERMKKQKKERRKSR